jgi:uncharacterized protein YacL (UPF0231 family)
MKDSIFNFLGEFSSTLEELALRIETLIWDQPQAALTQMRLFTEKLVSMVFEQENMSEVYPLKQVEKINRLYKHDIISEDIYKKLEYIRKNGNIASHQVTEIDLEVVIRAHRALFDLCVWYAEIYGSHTFNAPKYELPSKQNQDHQMIKQWMDGFIQDTGNRIAEIEAELEKLKQEKQQQQTTFKKMEETRVVSVRNQDQTTERTVPLEKFQSTFEKVNFKLTNITKKAAEFEFEEHKEFVYLLDRVTPTIVIHPTLIDQYNALIEVPNKQVKSTALRRFPKKEEDGKLMSNFGYTYTFQTKSELEALLGRIVEALGTKFSR